MTLFCLHFINPCGGSLIPHRSFSGGGFFTYELDAVKALFAY